MEEEKQAFYVESVDGRKFKMVIRGSLSKLSVAKIRRYLKRYGVPSNHLLLSHDTLLTDNMVGEEFGLANNSILHLRNSTDELHDEAEANIHTKQDNNLRDNDRTNATNILSKNNYKQNNDTENVGSVLQLNDTFANKEQTHMQESNKPVQRSNSNSYDNVKNAQMFAQQSMMPLQERRFQKSERWHEHKVEEELEEQEKEEEEEEQEKLENVSRGDEEKSLHSAQSVQLSATSLLHRYMPHSKSDSKKRVEEHQEQQRKHEPENQEKHLQMHKEQILALEAENRLLRKQLEATMASSVTSTEASNNNYNNDNKSKGSMLASSQTLIQNALANLRVVSDKLGVTLSFDHNLSCVISTESNLFVILTIDVATGRLYMYSTVLERIPVDTTIRMKLYEILLQGSLVGREVCGGGMGISLEKNMVVLASSFSLLHCDNTTLIDTLPVFVATLRRWQALVKELVES